MNIGMRNVNFIMKQQNIGSCEVEGKKSHYITLTSYCYKWHCGIDRWQIRPQPGEQDKGVCHFIYQKEVHSLSLAQTLTLTAALIPNRATSVFTHTVLSNVYCTKLPHVPYTIFTEIKISWIALACAHQRTSHPQISQKKHSQISRLCGYANAQLRSPIPFLRYPHKKIYLPAQLQCLGSGVRKPGNKARLLNMAWWIK